MRIKLFFVVSQINSVASSDRERPHRKAELRHGGATLVTPERSRDDRWRSAQPARRVCTQFLARCDSCDDNALTTLRHQHSPLRNIRCPICSRTNIWLCLSAEKDYPQARYHFVRSEDGEGCAAMLMEYHITLGYPSEVDLFIAQAVFQ